MDKAIPTSHSQSHPESDYPKHLSEAAFEETAHRYTRRHPSFGLKLRGPEARNTAHGHRLRSERHPLWRRRAGYPKTCLSVQEEARKFTQGSTSATHGRVRIETCLHRDKSNVKTYARRPWLTRANNIPTPSKFLTFDAAQCCPKAQRPIPNMSREQRRQLLSEMLHRCRHGSIPNKQPCIA